MTNNWSVFEEVAIWGEKAGKRFAEKIVSCQKSVFLLFFFASFWLYSGDLSIGFQGIGIFELFYFLEEACIILLQEIPGH